MLKHLSIKTRVIFWYTFTMVVMIALVFSILILAGKQAALDDAKTSLTISTDMAVGNVTITNGRLMIDDDFIYYMDHTWIVLVKDNGVTISGLTPEGFPENVPFQADRIRQVGTRKTPFYVYDRLIENQKAGKLWIRGMTSASLSLRDPAVSHMILLFMIVLPILIILSLTGGWLITRRAFLPLKQLNDAVAQIQEASDLSKNSVYRKTDSPENEISTDSSSVQYRQSRFDLSTQQDEIGMTALVFDQMLDRIGDSFQREKQFTNDASHELRTPTAVIYAQCEYALENLEDPEEVEQSLRIIHSQSAKMSALIEQLLMLARADRAVMKPVLQNTDISLLVEEAASIHQKDALMKNISVRVQADEGIYASVDAALISRAIDNLISNAIKYGKPDGFVKIFVTKTKTGIRLAVTDNGIGIPAENIDKIWNRFYRVDPTGNVPGLGLGLPLARCIIEAHGGTISVKSQPEDHTEFTVFLPF